MAANQKPIYSVAPDVQWSTGAVTGGNTTADLTTGTIYQIFTASTSEGGRVDRVLFQPLGTNTATVARIWINNNATTTSPGNNAQLRDITLPATTVNQTLSIGSVEVQMDLPIPAAYKLYCTLGTTVAAGFSVTTVGGKY